MQGEEPSDEPRWVNRARHISHKPNKVEKVPRRLEELGEVFFPIPARRKGHNWPHHMQEYRYDPKSEELNAYLEQGWGYGISCAGDLAVLDIDELEYASEITEFLPETLYQKTGSGEGYHLFYYVTGLNDRQMLYIYVCPKCKFEFTEWDEVEETEGKKEQRCPECGYKRDMADDCKRHLGEVKCDPHGYVVGPGSVHPSGNTYGPLLGDSIKSIPKQDFLDAIGDHIISDDEVTQTVEYERGDYNTGDGERHDLYQLSATDVMPFLERGARMAHPVHGSSTGSNFQLNESGDTFVCWRCQHGAGDGCVLSAQHLLAAEGLDDFKHAGDHVCQTVRRNWQSDNRLHYYAWMRALEEGYVDLMDIPYAVLHGYAVHKGIISKEKKIKGELYHKIKEALIYEIQMLM